MPYLVRRGILVRGMGVETLDVMSFDNGHISSFVIGQRKVGLESLVAMEESMQKKVDSIRYEMEKEKARYKRLLDKLEGVKQ